MTTLLEKLPLPQKRKELVEACCRVLDSEVQGKKGFSGLAIKAAYKVMQTIKPGAVRDAVDALFDEFIQSLEPLHEKYQQNGSSQSFGQYMMSCPKEAAELLVGITDARAQRTQHKSLKSAYQRLRPSAVQHVSEAISPLASLVDRYYG